jgi:hypothetical protein
MWQPRSPTNFFAFESVIVDILLSFDAIIFPQSSSAPPPRYVSSRSLAQASHCFHALELRLDHGERRRLAARDDARGGVHVHDDRPEPAQLRWRIRGDILIDAANRLAVVVDRPVLAGLGRPAMTVARVEKLHILF